MKYSFFLRFFDILDFLTILDNFWTFWFFMDFFGFFFAFCCIFKNYFDFLLFSLCRYFKDSFGFFFQIFRFIDNFFFFLYGFSGFFLVKKWICSIFFFYNFLDSLRVKGQESRFKIWENLLLKLQGVASFSSSASWSLFYVG